jgi:hypothetical protein
MHGSGKGQWRLEYLFEAGERTCRTRGMMRTNQRLVTEVKQT